MGGKNKNKNKNKSVQPNQKVKHDEEPKVVELSDSEDEQKEKLSKKKQAKPKETPKVEEVEEVKEEVKPVIEQPKSGKDGVNGEKATSSTETDKKVSQTSVSTAAGSKKEGEEAEVTQQIPTGDCAVCDKLAKSFCSICKHVFYCSRDCQRKHWNSHKEDCKSLAKLPYRIERNEQLGRFLVATTDLKPGQLIFNELPMIIGPRQLTKPVCLGCHIELKDPQKVYKCSRCSWPLCSQKCEDSPYHDLECRILRAAGQKAKIEVFGQVNMMYACITVLRALALREGSPKVWKEYTKFESHLEERMGTQVYTKVNKEKVVFFIQHYLKLLSHYSDLEILEACGKLDTNCFELKIKDSNGETQNLRAMYRLGSILSHECRPNTRHTFDPDYAVNLFATVPIAKGSLITVSYTQTLWNTMNRRQHLKMSKCFWCVCPRCADPTEFGTYISALNCAKCPGKMIHSNPLDQDANFVCEKCANTLEAKQIRDGQDRLTGELKTIDRSNPENLEKFLQTYKLLPETYQLSREIQYSLLLQWKPNEDLPTATLLKKSLICKQLLELADKIEPGMTKWRGQILFELQSSTVILAQRALEDEKLPKWKAQEIFEENIERLRESIAILQVEPESKKELQAEMAKLSQLMDPDDNEEDE